MGIHISIFILLQYNKPFTNQYYNLCIKQKCEEFENNSIVRSDVKHLTLEKL